MLMRKINAGLSLLTTLLLLDHVIFNTVRMLFPGAIQTSTTVIPWVLFMLMLVHAGISIGLAVAAHAGTEKGKCRSYPQLNRSTMIQRISGMALIVLSGLHVADAAGMITPPPVIGAIVPAVFFTVALAHVAVSTAKAFITLGIGSAAFVKAVDLAVKVICAATLIAALTGFYRYLV